ncbi:MAG: hypothetical protein EAZ57_04520 [Cytophagales bacterium]|nr:MAG: hypothetical protein EAZ67_05540 [Cytophagales bacterium]TAF61260.1 MAG: hypothetical protein EAZ57_04520 [Cytophagales bacterium]
MQGLVFLCFFWGICGKPPFCARARAKRGLTRQYFPKGIDLTKISDEQVLHIKNILNSRPKKSINFHSPSEQFKNDIAFIP